MAKGSGTELRGVGVVFDLDGTLLDTLQDIALAANAALQELGQPALPLADYKMLVGEGVQSLMRRALAPCGPGKAMIERGARCFERHYQRFWDQNTRPYPGMAGLLDALQDRQVPMAVLSNKPHEFTCLCVERLLANWQFGAVLGAVQGMPRKPDPAGLFKVMKQLGLQPDRTFYLGDTAIDMQTALGGGCFPVGALWGFRDAWELRQAGARILIEQPGELLELMSSIDAAGW